MIGTPARFTIRALFAALILTGAVCALGDALPAGAGAYATIEGSPIFSTAPGLPDGRVYEQVSPANKNGNEAGADDRPNAQNPGGEERYAFAAADGDSVLFEGTGPMGEAATAMNPYFVATKNEGAAGWATRAITPAPRQPVPEIGGTLNKLTYVDPSADLSRVMFKAGDEGTYALLGPETESGSCRTWNGGNEMYLAGSDPFVPATWLERPEIENPIENCAEGQSAGAPVGGTPDFGIVYFTYPGTLLPEDASRASHAGTGERVEAWGFYEDREGALREAGVLPDGGLDPFGAVPAASGHARAIEGNQVSTQVSPGGAPAGSRAFFVSPDPASCETNGGQNDCAVDPPELYVRENGERTQLVSRDTLLPKAGGLPASAPDGVFEMPNSPPETPRSGGSYVFASPDGSQAFFQSEDRLTSSAPEGPPGDTSPKTYDFDLETGTLTYLPNVAGEIIVTDSDGSSFAFVRPGVGGEPAELDLWSAGPGGGSITPVTQLPGGATSGGQHTARNTVYVSVARMSSDGSVLVFATNTILPGGFNSGGQEEIYRYEASANALGCVSCPPHGVTPTGNVSMSPLQYSEQTKPYPTRGMVDERGISSDGDRIFFDTPDPLVPQDKNTGATIQGPEGPQPQGRDVYEWENGVVYLISAGKSAFSSYFLDSSENGDDVFFATAEGLVPGDTDGAYDAYDARVPHPGDNPPAAAVPCEGAVCQGPPRVPSPLAAPGSATFSGLGNPAPELSAALVAKPKSTPKRAVCKRGYVKKHGRCVTTKPKKKARKSDRRGR